MRKNVDPNRNEVASSKQRTNQHGERAAQSAGTCAGTAPTTDPAGAQPDRGQIEVIRPMWATSTVIQVEAWDHTLRRAVMIRTLAPTAAQNAAAAQDFWRQARNQARLRHDRILPVLFVDKRCGWVVTEFCSRRLEDEMEAGLAPEKLLPILRQCLEGLVYLHDLGQLHGNVHPGVILLAADGSAKLDCPNGRELGTELALHHGLEKYAAPESLDEHKFGAVGCGCDIYSLGITALESLAGKKFRHFFREFAFDLSDGEAWLRWNLSADAQLPKVNRVLPKISPTLATVIDGMLEKRVAKRLTAAEALAALAGRTSKPSAGGPLTLPMSPPHTLATVQSVEPISLLNATRGPDLYTPGPAAALAVPGSQSRWERWFSAGNANYLAAGMILIAAAIAGVSLVGSSPRAASNDVALAAPTEAVAIEPANAPPAEPVAPPPPPRSPEPLPVATAPPPPDKNPAPPASVPLEPGQLAIQLVPDDAWLEFNGLRHRGGFTTAVPAGTYRVRASKWDSVPCEREFKVVPGATVCATITLQERPPVPMYEPVPQPPAGQGRLTDPVVAHVLDDLWRDDRSRGTLIDLERQLRSGQAGSQDPRVLHALAVLMLGPHKSVRRAALWYERAAAYAPAAYSWPYKGYVKCLLAEGDEQEALRRTDDFVHRAVELAAKYPGQPKARVFLNDSACFAGRVIGFVQAVAPDNGDQTLLVRSLAACLPADAADILRTAVEESVARHQESESANEQDAAMLVWRFLGDSVAGERRALLASIEAGRATSGGATATRTTELLHPHRRPAAEEFLISQSRSGN